MANKDVVYFDTSSTENQRPKLAFITDLYERINALRGWNGNSLTQFGSPATTSNPATHATIIQGNNNYTSLKWYLENTQASLSFLAGVTLFPSGAAWSPAPTTTANDKIAFANSIAKIEKQLGILEGVCR